MSTTIADTVVLLRKIVSISSLSKMEDEVANYLADYLYSKGIKVERIKNNIVAYNQHYNAEYPTLMLNSHLDTVAPSQDYTFDPLSPDIQEDRVLGLGSNDAGGAVCSLLSVFLQFYKEKMPINLMLVLTTEEEISGQNGMKFLKSRIAKEASFAIIGEPTSGRAAIAERGLLVLDGETKGVSSHAAYDFGTNAIYLALDDINTIRNYNFDRISPIMGKMTPKITMINAGKAHNIVPERCSYVVDIRTTEVYSHEEIVEMLQADIQGTIAPRSLTNTSSATPLDSPLMDAITNSEIETFISLTTSDWISVDVPAVKMGPGDSLRSHKADEYILVSELEDINTKYNKIIKQLINKYNE